jgi:uncharacterized glyoxalase superfamily protein PhnB
MTEQRPNRSHSRPDCEQTRALIPHLSIRGCAEAIEFYQQAFRAQEVSRLLAGDGQRILHAVITIDGNMIMLADDFSECRGGKPGNPLALGGSPVTIHRYVDDCDAAFQQAIAAGATARMEPTDMFWGDRYCVIVDPFGHNWSLATHVRDVPPEELAAAAQAMMPAS